MKPDLTTKVGGLILRNPTMLSAGVLGMTGKSLRAAWEAGAGAVVTKSLGIEPRKGYSNPTIVDVGCGFINAMGLPNSGANEFLNELSDASIGEEIVIVGSIYGVNPHEFAETAQILAKGNISAIELNVSCPHTKGMGAEVGQDPNLVQEVVRAVKARTKLPVFIKLTPNVTSIVDLALAAEKAGANAIVAINTLRAMVIDIDTGYPVLANKVGGLSGPAIKPVAVRNVYEISQAVRIPVIGCGGITDWRDAVEFLLAGASAIQIGTAVAYRDLKIFGEVTSGVSKYLAEKNFKEVEEIVGLSHKARP
ncbi:dihydroorotate dehydrogenase [Candidatus Bathyarchaeota archaeon]|nr:dihydroorotate dehydrogenase [Candidatus Bathyarchaeota archaeon]